MAHLRPYCASKAIIEAFIRPAIGLPRCREGRPSFSRTFIPTTQLQQKLSRKQREQSGILTEEDHERIRKAKEKAAERAAKKAQAPTLQGNRAEKLLKSLGKRKNGNTPEKAEQRPLENDEIKDPEISLVDRDGRYVKRISTGEVLWKLDRAEETLMVIKAADESDPRSIPLCKIFSLATLNEREQKAKQLSAQREQGEKLSKELELTWTIEPADMDLKCRQIAKFLEEGRKIDVTIARKYKRRVPDKTMAELQAVVDKIRAVATTVKGAREYRESDGRLAETMVLFFEGPAKGSKDTIVNPSASDVSEAEKLNATAAS